MKLSVIGTGYVGLVVGTCFAESGNTVLCVDIDINKIKMLSKGHSPIYEPGLEELIRENLAEKRLRFTTNLKYAVRNSDVIFLALPTPQSEDGSADLKHVLEVAKQIGKYMNGYKVIVNKSTIPVGTSEKVRRIIRRETDVEFDVVSNPEFLKEGSAVNDFQKPDRIVIGSSSQRAIALMQELYAPFVRTGNPIIVMDEKSSELTKYAANSFLATKISFMNEIAGLCERVGADVEMVRRGIGTDPRIGQQFLFAGVGYGGSCFPKDVTALEKTAREHKYKLRIISEAQKVNRLQRKHFVSKIIRYFNGQLENKVFAVWGLSFKPKTDDMREAPSITIINELLKRGAVVHAYDPIAIEAARKIFGRKIKYFKCSYDALTGADALVIVTEWSEFRRPDFQRMKELMKQKIIFDGRNIYDPKSAAKEGFTYFGVGRGVDAIGS